MFGRLKDSWTRTRQRLQQTRARHVERRKAICAAIATDIGGDELGLGLAFVVLTAGLWPRLGRDTLIVDGAILLWMYLPGRVPFVIWPTVKDERKKD